MLGEFYFQDDRVALVPSEHLAVDGIDPGFAAQLALRPGWTTAHVALLERGIELYLARYEALAGRFPFLSAPRLRTLAVIAQPESVRPYARVLNESTSTLYLDDLDPAHSHPEFVAFVLALGERREETGEVLLAAIHLAPWWFDRTAAEVNDFTAATELVSRPDAPAYRAIAGSIGWLRKIRHRKARAARRSRDFHEITGTGLLVPHALRAEPEKLMAQIRSCASDVLSSFYARYRGRADSDVASLTGWLARAKPSVVITDANQSVLWSAGAAGEGSRLRARLSDCASAVIQSIHEDLRCVGSRTRNFLDSLRNPGELAPPDPEAEQRGYAFMHRTLGEIAYNLDEPAVERLQGPAIPYARAMLGARTLHEWAHRAVDSGWVVRTVDEEQWNAARRECAALLDEIVDHLPRPIRDTVAPDLSLLSRSASPGTALAALFEKRMEDYSSNLLAARFQTALERESYVRQNIRPLRKFYAPAEKLRELVRYLYEIQYLHFSGMEDPQTYFLESTWFEVDFLEPRILDLDRFEALRQAVAGLCRAHAVDESRFSFGG